MGRSESEKHCWGEGVSPIGLFYGKTLRQQIQRTLSTDKGGSEEVMMREKEVCPPGLVCWPYSSLSISWHSAAGAE